MAKRKNTKKQDGPFILARRMPERRQLRFLLWHLGLLLLACGALTAFTLRLSYSNLNPDIWMGYLEDLWIPLINLALVYGSCLVLYALLGRAWPAYLLTSLVWLGVALGNYYLIIIRTDPLQFVDLTCLREALAITGTQGYELELSAPILVSVGGVLGFTVLLALLSRWKPRWRGTRWLALTFSIAAFAGVSALGNSWTMLNLTQNYQHINTWSTTQIYVSRGVVYSFYRTVFSGSGKPDNYSEADTVKLLNSYSEEAIPKDRKVDVFVIMRESYSDLSELDCDREAIDFSCYERYHNFVNESVLKGNLVTNGFGGDTKNAERCFLTGYYTPRDWRKPTDSYVWYLKQEGYRTEGAHPFNGWFYNRLNVNRYLGFDAYEFREDTFDALVGEEVIANDDVLYDEIWRMYGQSDPDTPYFNFSVTYEGHGPYAYSRNQYRTRFVKRDANSSDGFAMTNYLSHPAPRRGADGPGGALPPERSPHRPADLRRPQGHARQGHQQLYHGGLRALRHGRGSLHRGGLLQLLFHGLRDLDERRGQGEAWRERRPARGTDDLPLLPDERALRYPGLGQRTRFPAGHGGQDGGFPDLFHQGPRQHRGRARHRHPRQVAGQLPYGPGPELLPPAAFQLRSAGG